jgi:hypothetical protein
VKEIQSAIQNPSIVTLSRDNILVKEVLILSSDLAVPLFWVTHRYIYIYIYICMYIPFNPEPPFYATWSEHTFLTTFPSLYSSKEVIYLIKGLHHTSSPPRRRLQLQSAPPSPSLRSRDMSNGLPLWSMLLVPYVVHIIGPIKVGTLVLIDWHCDSLSTGSEKTDYCNVLFVFISYFINGLYVSIDHGHFVRYMQLSPPPYHI